MSWKSLHGPKYFGGKTYFAHWINSLLPASPRHYIEPYAGMLSVLLARPKGYHEVINDLDEKVVTWWRVVRDQPEELEAFLGLTPYSRQVFQESQRILNHPYLWDNLKEEAPVVAAAHVMITLHQGFLGVTSNEGGWRLTNPSIREVRPKAWNNLSSRIPTLAERLREVELDCCPAMNLIKRWSSNPSTLLYLDPPYKEAGHHYRYQEDLEKLYEFLTSNNIKAKVAISGYKSCGWERLEKYGWRREEKETPHVIGNGRRIECLWLNYPPLQNNLFN